MKALIIDILLRRGAPALAESIGKAIRHGLTTFGGVLIANGWATDDEVGLMIGAITTGVGVALSFVRTWIQARLD